MTSSHDSRETEGLLETRPSKAPLLRRASYSSVRSATSLDSYSQVESTLLSNNWSFEDISTRFKYYVPALKWIPEYSLMLFGRDLFSALTVVCLSVPQSLSYASALARLPPVYGLFTACIPGIIYAFFGMSRQMSVGPESVAAILVGFSVAARIADITDPQMMVTEAIATASVISFLVGTFTLILGLLRVGFLDSLLSRALLRGFITAIGVIILVGQSITLLGLDSLVKPRDHTTLQKLIFVILNMGSTHLLTATISLVSVGFLFVVQDLKRRFKQPYVQYLPEFLMVVIISTIACWLFEWSEQGVLVVGKLEKGSIPFPHIPPIFDHNRIRELAVPAVLISLLGFVSSAAITKSFATLHNYPVSPNRELVALGISNITGSLFQAMPAFGSMPRSRLANSAGARTQMAGLMSSLLVMVAILYLLPCFEFLPKAVLSSLIFVAGTGMVLEAPGDILFLWRIRAVTDLALMVLTFVLTIAVGIEVGTFVSISLALLTLVKRSTRPSITILGQIPGSYDKFKPIRDFPEAVHAEGLLILKIDEPLHFANSGSLKDRLRRCEQYGDFRVHPSAKPYLSPIRNVVFEVENMTEVDASAVQILLEIMRDYRSRGIGIYFVNLREQHFSFFQTSGLYDLIGSDHFCQQITQVLDHIKLLERLEPLDHSPGVSARSLPEKEADVSIRVEHIE
ncbi:hypothetical protein K493DRAFT_329674 [Basidiobolus meristosporus CBS 931.73]|uniref:STAS domain-containing protein n=1 Tax=Basidiobolus meristosporus CBS 931.73 TaxID=1314790 RepID=A0A1Y1YDN8_9FUNG|nr:hypothetical protein K493DRAFT_329674 [Basidiobolus meristosporus CBS 931.73]|eukprot:ORX96055.1 hypothetical protein K493DRAFT_329674 [Basidiobolus meristosporus CBS 931.73]